LTGFYTIFCLFGSGLLFWATLYMCKTAKLLQEQRH